MIECLNLKSFNEILYLSLKLIIYNVRMVPSQMGPDSFLVLGIDSGGIINPSDIQ